MFKKIKETSNKISNNIKKKYNVKNKKRSNIIFVK